MSSQKIIKISAPFFHQDEKFGIFLYFFINTILFGLHKSYKYSISFIIKTLLHSFYIFLLLNNFTISTISYIINISSLYFLML